MLMLRLIVVSAMFVATPAFAQQQQQPSPTQLAIQINQVINQMALALEQRDAQIHQLQQEIAGLKAQQSKK